LESKTAANDIGNLSGTAILDLNAGQDVSMAIANQSSTADIVIENTNFTMTYIGG